MEKVTVEIGIDCAPCTPRPDTYIGEALKILEIDTKENREKDATSKIFGAWTWEFECNKDTYYNSRDKLMAKYNELYQKGRIRGFYHEVIG